MVATSVLPSPVSSSAMQRLMDRDAAHDLHVELALADRCAWRPRAPGRTPRPAGCSANHPAGPSACSSWARAFSSSGRAGLQLGLKCVDPIDQNGVSAQPAGMGRPGQLLNPIQPGWAKAAGHGDSDSPRFPSRVAILPIHRANAQPPARIFRPYLTGHDLRLIIPSLSISAGSRGTRGGSIGPSVV